MKITRIEPIPVLVPLKKGLTTKTAHGEHIDSPYVLVLVHTNEGLIGYGEATLSPRWSGETSPGCVAAIRDVISPALEGADPRDVRASAGYVVHDGRMWIVGGDPLLGHYQDDVWCSSDGVDWRWVNRHNPVPWGPRSLHYTFVFQQRIWVLGGQTTPQFAPGDEIFYDDVWNTDDGLHWDRVDMTRPFTPHRAMIGGSAVFRDRIWLLGGWVGQDVADVWYSPDGISWHEVPNTPWHERHAASVFVFRDALWMVAGSYMGRDVWKLTRRVRA